MKFNHLPVIPLRITSHYGIRSTGIRGSTTNHKGVDLGRDRTRSETSLFLVKDGRCTMNGWNDYRGWYVEFDIGQGYTVLYQHLKSKSPCRIAKMYESGSIIGIMGNSSDKSKLNIVTHLHFEIHLNGIPKNPEPFLYDLEAYELITQTKVLVNGQEKTVNRILKDGENYIRLRDIEDVLKVADVEYDFLKNLPKVVD